MPEDGGWTLETLKFQPMPLNKTVGAVIAGFDINISFKKEPFILSNARVV